MKILHIFTVLILFLVFAEEGFARSEPQITLQRHMEANVIDFVLSEKVTDKTLVFMGAESNVKEQTPLVRELFTVKGVKWMILRPDKITIIKSDGGSWDDIIPEAERIIRKHLKKEVK